MKYRQVFRSAVDRKLYGTNLSPDKDPTAFLYKAMLTPTDIADIEAAVILDEVMGMAYKKLNLMEVCKVINMDKLIASVDIRTKFTAHEKVEPLEEADMKKGTWERVAFDLWKNVAHVGAADEAQMKAAHDVLGMDIADAAKSLATSANGQIATVAETCTYSSGGSDWGGANNPYNDIMTAFASISGTYEHEPSHIAAHPYVWMDFFGNDFVKGSLVGEVLPGAIRTGGNFAVPGLPGVIGVSDWGLTSTIALVLAKEAGANVFGNGPSSAELYRNSPAGYDAYIIRQWLEPKSVVQGAKYKLTGVHA